MPLIPRQNTEDEVAAFASVCETLGGFDERVSAEWADGYLTALAAGWRAVPFEEAVAAMCGDYGRHAASVAEARQILGLG